MIYSGIPIGTRPQNHEKIMGSNQQPWLPIEAIEFLEQNLKVDSVGLEFGCGSSSFWFSKLIKKIYSVESDPNWCQEISELIENFSIDNIILICHPCEMKNIYAIDTETDESYFEYSGSVTKVEEELDFVLVDGVGRSLCIEKSLEKIKLGGYLIIDNAERPAYFDAISKIPKEWEYYEFVNSVDKTIIFKKNTNLL